MGFKFSNLEVVASIKVWSANPITMKIQIFDALIAKIDLHTKCSIPACAD